MNNAGLIAIIGMGVTGRAVLRLLLAAGVDRTTIILYDKADPMADTRDHLSLTIQHKVQTFVVSPGVPLKQDWILNFQKSGGKITSELELAFSYLTTERVIGVTGSIGKSTTISILGAGLMAFSPESFVGGNLGTPLANYVADLLESNRSRAPWVLLELSSYQLENFNNLICDFSIITYFTANHLERYSKIDDYYRVKWGLVEKTKLFCVLNRNGGDLFEFTKLQSVNKNNISFVWTDSKSDVITKYSMKNCALVGDHNIHNLAMAAKIAELAGWPDQAFDAMKAFPGLPHRLENLGRHSDILFINDSKATTIESSLQAVTSLISSLSKAQTLWVLLGGKDKNLPWAELASLAVHKNLRPVFFGEVGERARALSNLVGESYNRLGPAIRGIKKFTIPGDVVLLSPGGTSLDEFKNFEERGLFFKNEVLKYW